MHSPNYISSHRLPSSATACQHTLVWRLQRVARSSLLLLDTARGVGVVRRPGWLPSLLSLLALLVWITAPQALLGADPPSYTFKPKNESGSAAKGWYIHLPPAFTATDVIVKDSGGKILTNVRVIDRGRKTGVTVLFETDGDGVPDNGTDEIKLTLTKPLGKTGTSGFRDKPGVKGVPVGEATFDPPWTDNKGGKGGTQPKEEKKRQEAPPEEGDETLIPGADPQAALDDEVLVDLSGDLSAGDLDESGEVLWNDYPYTSEETNDELFGDWADGKDWDDSAGDVLEVVEPGFGEVESPLRLYPVPVTE